MVFYKSLDWCILNIYKIFIPLVFVTGDGVKVYVFPKDHRPAHVHIYWPRKKNPEAWAKIVIATGEVLECEGFTQSDIKRILKFIAERKQDLEEAWYELEG